MGINGQYSNCLFVHSFNNYDTRAECVLNRFLQVMLYQHLAWHHLPKNSWVNVAIILISMSSPTTDVSELRTQEPTECLLDTPTPSCVCVKPPVPRPSKLPIVEGTDHVGAPGKPFASWWYGPERTGVLHRRHSRSVRLKRRFRTRAWIVPLLVPCTGYLDICSKKSINNGSTQSFSPIGQVFSAVTL
jgi:hypothetical protein